LYPLFYFHLFLSFFHSSYHYPFVVHSPSILRFCVSRIIFIYFGVVELNCIPLQSILHNYHLPLQVPKARAVLLVMPEVSSYHGTSIDF
jgi:hypothetical protein